MSFHDNIPQSTTPAPAFAPPGNSTGTESRTSIFLPPMLQGIDQGPPLPSALNSAPSAFTLMRAFQRRWPLAIGAGLLAALLTLLAVFFVFPAKYVASYSIKINSAKTKDAIGDRAEDVDFGIFKGSQAALASSRSVIVRALEMQNGGRFIKDLSIVRDSVDPIEWLQLSIKTEFHPKAPEIMAAKLSADQPEELTQLLNALAQSLIAENDEREDADHKMQIDRTQNRARQLQTEIDNKRSRLNELVRNLGPDALNQNKKMEQLSQVKTETQKALRDKQYESASVRTKLEALDRRMENPDAPVPQWFISEMLRVEPDATSFFQNVTLAHQDYDRALTQLPGGAKDPGMKRYLINKENAVNALAAYQRQKLPVLTQKWREKESSDAAQQQTKYRDELAALTQQEKLLETNIRQTDADISTYQPKNLPAPVVSLQNEIESSELALKKIGETIQYMKINAPMSRVSILQPAIAPNSKDANRQMKVAGAGSIGMFLLTVLGISFIEFRSRKITSSDEVKRGLGLNVIGSVPTLPEKARSPVAQTKLDPYWQNQLMESVDTIRTMLLHSARGSNTRVIMVTSAVGGEGKTSLSSQLAASLARAWKKTLLIDGDLRNPAAHKLFEVAQEPGLSEVLRGELSASEAVRSTPLSRLWVLPAGHWDSHAVQALAQDNVRTMLEELKQQYDFIILDSCPILPVADSLLLGQNVDGVIVTVMRDVSRSPAVYAAQQRLESLGVKMLGAVVIGAKNEIGPLGYKYAYQARP